MAAKPVNGDFSHVEAWVFDLDNTLYPADCNLFAEIDTRMGDFIAERFGADPRQLLARTIHYRHRRHRSGPFMVAD